MASSKVVAKYDIYFSRQALEPKKDEGFYLMRFPAMRSQLSSNNPSDINIKLKPKSKRCRLEIDADTSSSSFSMDAAKTLASKSVPFTFDVDHVNKYFFSSTTIKVDDRQLMVGKITHNKLVISQVDYLMNMRPDFSHFDRREEIDFKEEIKAVTVKFAAPDKVGMNSRHANVDESLQEEFKSFKYYHRESREAIAQRGSFLEGVEGLTIKKEPGEPDDPSIANLEIDVKPKLAELNAQVAGKSTVSKPSPTVKIQDFKQANSKIKDCLMRAKVVSYEEICSYIKKNNDLHFTSDQILPTIESLAVLVQGNWVVKSEIIYEDGNDPKNPTLTEITGIPVNSLALARDYLLWVFCQNDKVSRKTLNAKLKIPDHDILDLLKQLATFDKSDKTWKFRLPTDTEFLSKHPDVVSRQKSLWKVRKSNKLGSFFS